ncbi:hypothetical protein APHAL10511_008285 [Amanita phalloides]|nr:hypothetical protein APHAL10511_008285 [Amanita phalloides]
MPHGPTDTPGSLTGQYCLSVTTLDTYDEFMLSPIGAPSCKYVHRKFILYYQASSPGSRNSAIFLATSETGLPGEWSNKGLITSTSDADDYNAIDPNLFINDDGKWWLSFGSYWSGIKVIELDPSTGHRLGSKIHSVATRKEDHRAMEGSNIIKQDGFYWLLFSRGHACCNLKSTYEVCSGKSLSPVGPYVDQAGTPLLSGGCTLILSTHGKIHGPGGQDILTDTDGRIILYRKYSHLHISVVPNNRF